MVTCSNCKRPSTWYWIRDRLCLACQATNSDLAWQCEHANENPIVCPCKLDCYCCRNTCKGRPRPTMETSPCEESDPPEKDISLDHNVELLSVPLGPVLWRAIWDDYHAATAPSAEATRPSKAPPSDFKMLQARLWKRGYRPLTFSSSSKPWVRMRWPWVGTPLVRLADFLTSCSTAIRHFAARM